MKLPFLNQAVTFQRFMEFCLYDVERGYYRSGKAIFGPQGDYYTSPYTHQIFAHCLADTFARYLELLPDFPILDLVDLGPGEGGLGQEVLKRLKEHHPGIFERVQYLPVEVGQELPLRIRGVVFSNEFFDALPVHRVRVRNSQLREIYVRVQEEISEEEGEVSDPRIFEYMKMGFREWREGYEYEVNLKMVEVLEELDRRLVSGAIITLDYGYDWPEYARRERPTGTLLCYYRHQVVEDPYRNLCKQDITAHVNFEVMQGTAQKLGWRSQSLRSQRQFLLDWGLEGHLMEEEAQGFLNPERLEERLGLKTLLTPGGISDTMKLLVQWVRMDIKQQPS